MLIVKRARRLSGRAVFLAALVVSSVAQAGNVPFRSQASNGAIQVRFEPTRQETRVMGRAAPGLCFSFAMPQEWRAGMDGPKVRLESVVSRAELDLSLRSADELGPVPQPDLTGRDAVLLQQDYESLLGRPAQSVSLASLSSGAARWSATWIDAQLPAVSHAMTVETFIVPLSNEWILELSPSNIETREAYNALVQRFLEGLSVQRDVTCGG